jgi:HEAT repeat protein
MKFGVKDIVPEFIELTKTADGNVESDYILKFADRGIKESIPELTRLLKHDSRFARIPAAIALVKLGEKKYITKDIIRDLQSCLYSEDIIYQNINDRVKETLKILGSLTEDSKTPSEPDRGKPVDGK